MVTALNASQNQDAKHRYPGITFIAQALNINSSRRVLDLGSASAASFNFFMRKGCTVRFENISQFVADQVSGPVESRDPKAIRAQLEGYLSGFRSHEKFDVVLTWDLFSFLDLEAIEWLMEMLGHFCHDNSLLHSVRYIEQSPLVPVQFQIVSDHEVKTLKDRHQVATRAPHSLPDLVRNLPFYHLDTCFTQQSGMPIGVSEDVFRFLPSKKNVLRHGAKLDVPEVDAKSLPGEPHRSYALEVLCDHLAYIEQPRILDLGANIATNLEFYNNFSSHVVFAQLYDDLKNNITPEEIRVNESLLNCEPDEKFDVIFAWGLLGYCTQEQLVALKERLLPHIHEGTKIHVVIYAGYTQPTAPDKYYIKNIHTLHLPELQDYNSTHLPLTAIRLLKILGDASYESSFIMKPGMAPNFFEHILVLQKHEIKARTQK